MKKKQLTIGLILMTSLLAVGSVFLSLKLQETENVAPKDSFAATDNVACYYSNSNGFCQQPTTDCILNGLYCDPGTIFGLNDAFSCDPGQMAICAESGPYCTSVSCGECNADCPQGTASVDPVDGACLPGSFKTEGTCSGSGNPFWGCCSNPEIPVDTTTPTISIVISSLPLTNSPMPILPSISVTPTETNTGIKCGNTMCVMDSDCEGFNNNAPGTYSCNQVMSNDPTQQRCEIICPVGTIKNGYCNCATPTPSPTQASRTNTPTSTPTSIITNASSTPIQTTLPPTALISDEFDRVFFGVILMGLGLYIYFSGNYLLLGSAFWNNGGKSMWEKTSLISQSIADKLNALISYALSKFDALLNKLFGLNRKTQVNVVISFNSGILFFEKAFHWISINSLELANKLSVTLEKIRFGFIDLFRLFERKLSWVFKIFSKTFANAKGSVKDSTRSIGLSKKEKFEEKLIKDQINSQP